MVHGRAMEPKHLILRVACALLLAATAQTAVPRGENSRYLRNVASQ